MTTGPERRAEKIARGCPWLSARKLAKLAGVRLELAKRILAEDAARRERVA